MIHKDTDKIIVEEWPADGLQHVKSCPVCEHTQRRLLHTGLRDLLFYTPGGWSLQECLNCGSAYPDPRPNPETIHLAYQNYYTHQGEPRSSVEELRGLKRLERAVANGYRNWRFGTAFEPASRLGAFGMVMYPPRRALLDRDFRNIPHAPSKGGRLLDVGFGDTGFLENARAAGWEVVGIDPDPEVVSKGLQRGFTVFQGDLDTLNEKSSYFDVITMSHVIEHVHEPRTSLQQVYRLLKPGGSVWIETPNIKSLGHDHFGRHWRGLEPPRHLVIFSTQSLTGLLRETGFNTIRMRTRHDSYRLMSERSREIGKDPIPADRYSKLLNWLSGLFATLNSYVRPEKAEFITLTAYKPKLENWER